MSKFTSNSSRQQTTNNITNHTTNQEYTRQSTNQSATISKTMPETTTWLEILPLDNCHVFRFDHGKYSVILALNAFKLLIGLIILWLVILAISLSYGSHHLSLSAVTQTLWKTAPNQVADIVVWHLRFPRALVASFTGMMLALSGASLQNVTRNPLADPSLVGVNQGASLAVVALIVGFPEISHYWRPLAAFAGALTIAFVIQSLSMHKRGNQTMRFMLTGIGIATFISSIINGFLTYGNLDRATSALGWLAGSVSAVTWTEVIYVGSALAILLPLVLLVSRSMSALRFSPEVAITLGINVTRARVGLITLSVILAAISVAAVGPIAFIGLVAPHIARRLVSCGVSMHLLLSALIGAVLVSFADFCGRTLFSPIEIPAGLFTALMGVPIFIILIIKANAKSNL